MGPCLGQGLPFVYPLREAWGSGCLCGCLCVCCESKILETIIFCPYPEARTRTNTRRLRARRRRTFRAPKDVPWTRRPARCKFTPESFVLPPARGLPGAARPVDCIVFCFKQSITTLGTGAPDGSLSAGATDTQKSISPGQPYKPARGGAGQPWRSPTK